MLYLWAQSLFQNGGTLTVNKLSGNSEILKGDCKTVCFCGNYSGNVLFKQTISCQKSFVAKDKFNEIDEFCWQLKDGINNIVENQIKVDCSVNLSTKEKQALIDCGKK